MAVTFNIYMWRTKDIYRSAHASIPCAAPCLLSSNDTMMLTCIQQGGNIKHIAQTFQSTVEILLTSTSCTTSMFTCEMQRNLKCGCRLIEPKISNAEEIKSFQWPGMYPGYLFLCRQFFLATTSQARHPGIPTSDQSTKGPCVDKVCASCLMS